jgi:hypothetical protein
MSVDANDPREALLVLCLVSCRLVSPPQAPASWHPASTESGERVLDKFSLLRRFSLAREGKSVASRLRKPRHASYFRADEHEKPAFDLPSGCREACLRPSFPRNPLFSRSPNPTLAPHAEQP